MPGQHSTRGPHTLWRLRSLCLAGPEPLWEYPGFFRPTRTGQEKNKKKTKPRTSEPVGAAAPSGTHLGAGQPSAPATPAAGHRSPIPGPGPAPLEPPWGRGRMLLPSDPELLLGPARPPLQRLRAGVGATRVAAGRCAHGRPRGAKPRARGGRSGGGRGRGAGLGRGRRDAPEATAGSVRL